MNSKSRPKKDGLTNKTKRRSKLIKFNKSNFKKKHKTPGGNLELELLAGKFDKQSSREAHSPVYLLYGLVGDGGLMTRRFLPIHTIMVEESINSGNKPAKTKTARPIPVYFWSVLDVQKWLRRHCSDYCNLYSENFLQHEITGRALIRINENTLLRIGIENPVHRREIWREIMKLRLKTDIMEIRDLERHTNYLD